MRRRLVQIVLVCWGVSGLLLAASLPSAAPVALLPEVALKPTRVTLSDLLPPEAPSPLRAACAEVPLGIAPTLASVRRITREEIERALVNQPELLAAISIPEGITIRRTYDQVSREQVAAAINTTLGRESIADPANFKFQLSTPVYFTGGDPGLEVTQIEFDSLHQVTRFRLRTSKEPGNLPFFVTVPGSLKGMVPPAPTARLSQAASQTVAPALGTATARPLGTATEKLVKAGIATRLVIEGADYRFTSTVIPMQPGVLGQEVRVRDPLTRKMFTAQVAGPGLLKGTL